MKRIAAIALILASVISMSAYAVFLGFGGNTKHIKVTKEVLLENGVPIFPTQIIHTKDGGYVVAGNIGTALAWATRVDAMGNMQWRYQIAPGMFSGTTFEGAVTLGDDSTLLCGYKTVSAPTVRMPRGFNIVGILTRIDKDGKVISDREIRPQEPGEFSLTYLHGCMPWGEGLVVIGYTTRVSGDPNQSPRKLENFHLILSLDATGDIKWEKLIPTTTGPFNPRTIYVAPDQELDLGSIRVSQSGEIKNIELLNETPYDHLIRQIIAEPDGNWKVDQRNSPLKYDLKHDFSNSILQPKVAYILPDQSLVQFGSVYRNGYFAAIEWQSSDRQQLELFEVGDVLWVNDAIPTGTPGEFVTIRQQNADIKKLGMYLSFVQIK